MDLRLLDEIVQFMDHDGLINRYDHIILAGAALGALGGGENHSHPHWKQTFFDHLEVAYKLHHIKDVYILEHRDCGAYREFLGAAGNFDDADPEVEAACHHKYAMQLTGEIESWCQKKNLHLHVKSFLMDLRGRVSLLHCPTAERAKARRKATKKKA
jgi:hypothetical protein